MEPLIRPNKNVTFRILDQHLEQIENEELIIHLSGLTQDNKTVYCKVLGYQPYCFLELPTNINWTGSKIDALKDYIKEKLKECPPDIMKFEIKKLAMYSVTRPILRINFKTEDSIRHLKNTLRYKWRIEGFNKEFDPNAFKLHEQNIPTLVKFGMEKKMDMAGWITVTPMKISGLPRDFSWCDYSIYTMAKYVVKADVPADILVDPLICSFDIELHSTNRKSSTPAPELPENVITMISLTFGRLTQELDNWDTYVITLYKGSKDPSGKYKATVIDCTGSEKRLLVNFTKLIKRMQPDIITGYNINGFDWGALLKRAELYQLTHRFLKMGKLKWEMDRINDQSWSSGARGRQEILYVKLNGIFNFDMYPEIRFNHNLPMYKLGFVAERFLGQGETKDDMPYQQMFALFDMIEVLERSLETTENQLDVDMAKKLVFSKVSKEELLIVPGMTNHVADLYNELKKAKKLKQVVWICREYMLKLLKYVIQDARICPALMKFLNSLTSLWENANISKCPPNYVYEKGQQIKVLAQYLEQAHWKNYVIPFYNKPKHVKEDDSKSDEDDDKKNYQGATVLKVKKGLYKDIAILDFKSLYPSIMIANNICHSTFRPNDDTRVTDDECNIAQWSEHIRCEHDVEKRKKKKGEKVYCGDHKFRFIKHDDDDNKKGLLPLLLDKLLKYREQVKKEKSVYDKKWKELKELQISRGFLSEEEQKEFMAADTIVNTLKVKQKLSDTEEKEMAAALKISNSLKDLKNSRGYLTDDEKKEYTSAKIHAGVLDARQLAIKISANSAYGFMGALTGYFPLIAGAASVTYYGRTYINRAMQIVETNFKGAEVIYGDTDSLFVDFHEPNLPIAFDKAGNAAKMVTNSLPNPLELQMENFYSPLLLLTKKRYEGFIIKSNGIIIEKVSKGSISKRRDNCDAARDIYKYALKSVMNMQQQDQTIYEINNQILNMYRGLVPLHNFVIYKGLKQTVEEYKNCAGHVLFAKRLEERGNVIKAGTRLEYVFLKKYGKGLKGGDIMEDWYYFLLNRHNLGLHIDYGYYLEHNVMKPVTEVLNIAYPCSEKKYYKPEEAFKLAMTAYLKPEWVKMLKPLSIEGKARYIAKNSKKKLLRDAAKNYYAKIILDKVYAKHGLRKRTPHRPKNGQSHIFLNDKIIQQIWEYNAYWHDVLHQINERLNLPVWIEMKWG